MRTDNRAMGARLRLVHPAGVPELSGREGVELCARHADALAGQADQATRLVVALLEDLGEGELFAAHRTGFGLHATLRALSSSLGELHTMLDELASGGFGDAS